MKDEKTIPLSEEDLQKVAGGNILEKVPTVDEHDYDEKIKKKVEQP